MAITLIHGYYACVSFVDDLVGTLLDELDRLELSGNTIVVLWGDHGWNLGEHTLWCKHCCFETSMRAPLLVRAPGMPSGVACGAPVEFIDIYPSLCELAGLPLPEHLQGTSFVPLLRGANGLPAREAAIGRYGSGETIRTAQYRYTEYLDNSNRLKGRMLYDHHADPGETVNIAEHPANRELVDRLSTRLRAIRAGKPKGK
jgi:arylsulfatase A-like enzyme